MSRLYACDRCRASIEATEPERREWTCITLAKIEATGTLQVNDLCHSCTGDLRRFLEGGKLEEVVPIPSFFDPDKGRPEPFNPDDEGPF